MDLYERVLKLKGNTTSKYIKGMCNEICDRFEYVWNAYGKTYFKTSSPDKDYVDAIVRGKLITYPIDESRIGDLYASGMDMWKALTKFFDYIATVVNIAELSNNSDFLCLTQAYQLVGLYYLNYMGKMDIFDKMILRYCTSVRAEINTPEVCVELAKKYCPQFLGNGTVAIVIFKNGSFVSVREEKLLPDETYEEYGIRTISSGNHFADKYETLCVDPDNRNSENENPHIFSMPCEVNGVFYKHCLYEKHLYDMKVIHQHILSDAGNKEIECVLTGKD